MISDAFAGLLEMTAEDGGYTQEAYEAKLADWLER